MQVGGGNRRALRALNKSTVARRAIKSAAIGLCNLRVRVREIEKKGGGGYGDGGPGSCRNYSHYRDRGENRPMFA